VHALDLPSLLTRLDGMIASGGRFTVGYANVHTVNQALEHADVAEFMRQADVVYCDGNGVRLAAALLGDQLPRRMTGADWIWDLARHCAERGHRLYWIGGAEGVTERAAAALQRAEPGLDVAGTWHGFFDKTGDGSEEVVRHVNASEPHVVLVGMGTPVQERWITRYRDAIDAPVVWALGATADFVSGELDRGPALLYDHGLEWLARLTVDPRRLWQRYLIGNTTFVARVLSERAHRRRHP
jgi:N-acetylglucosaminyldiphosphoundecaprenol N-acetyl-beta-D-mannosaminyltransferase